MATASVIRDPNPEYFKQQHMTTTYGKMLDIFGTPNINHNLARNQPITWKNLTDFFNGERSINSEDKVREFVMDWDGWHRAVMNLEETNDLRDRANDYVQFEPELPARLSEFVTVPLISHVAVQTKARLLMYGLGAMFEWGSLAHPRGVELYEKSMFSIASDITLLFKLVTHATLWKAKVEVAAIMALSGFPEMGGYAYERLSLPGFNFGVMHTTSRGLLELTAAVENLMTETLGTNFSRIILPQRCRPLASGMHDPVNQLALTDPAAMADIKANGYNAQPTVLGRKVDYEPDYMFRGRTEQPEEPMTVPVNVSAFWTSHNAYLSSYADSPNFAQGSTARGNAYLCPPNTSDFRNLRFLNLGKGDGEWDSIPVNVLIQNCQCYDNRDPMLPLKKRLYDDLALNHAQLAKDQGMTLPPGPGNKGKRISLFVYCNRQGVNRTVNLWGQVSRIYMSDAFLEAAVRVARARVVALIGGEEKVQAINRMGSILELAYNRNSGLPTSHIKGTDEGRYYFEALCFAISQHRPNANKGQWLLRGNEFGAVELPDLGANRIISFVNDKGAVETVTPVLGADGELTGFETGKAGIPYIAKGIPHGFCTIGHAQTLLRSWRAGELSEWEKEKDFKAQMEIIDEGVSALDLYIDNAVNIFGVKFDTSMGNTVTATMRKAYENLFHSQAVVPVYLRAREEDFGEVARRSNLVTAIYEMTWCGVNRAPLFFDLGAVNIKRDDPTIFPTGGAFMSSIERGVELEEKLVNSGTPPTGDELRAWRALAYAIDHMMAETPAGQDAEQGFIQLEKLWNDAVKTANVGDPADESTRATLGGWVKYEVERNVKPFAAAGKVLLDAVDADPDDAAPKTAAVANDDVKAMNERAETLAKTLAGVYNRLSKHSGFAVPTITRQLLDSMPRQYVPPNIRGAQAYRDAAGSPDQDKLSGYVNLRISVAPQYFFRAKTNPLAAYDNPLRPASPHEDFMRPLMPRRGAYDPNDLSSIESAKSLATLAHGSASNSIVSTWTGDLAVANYRKTPSVADQQPNLGPLDDISATLGYGDHSGRPLPSYFQWNAIAEIGDCEDMVNRLKAAGSYNDRLSRSLAFQFLGQPVYGKKQQEWADLNLPVFLSNLVIAHKVQFDMHSAYFLNPGIGTMYYGYNESAISTDLLHFKLVVQVRFFLGAMIRNENNFVIALNVAWRRYLGGIDKTFVNSTQYTTDESVADFNIRDYDGCNKSLFCLPMGPSQTDDDMSSEIISLVPKASDNSEMRQYYPTDGNIINSGKGREPTFPAAFEFNVLTQYYRAQPANPREQNAPYSIFRSLGEGISTTAYPGPQLIKSPEDGKLRVRRGGGPFKFMVPGIKPSLNGGPQIFSAYSRPLGALAMVGEVY